MHYFCHRAFLSHHQNSHCKNQKALCLENSCHYFQIGLQSYAISAPLYEQLVIAEKILMETLCACVCL